MGTKQLNLSTRHCFCISVLNVQNVPCQAQCDGFEASATFPGLVTVIFFLFLGLNSVLKRQWFESTEKVTAKATRALEHWQRYRNMVSRNACKSFTNGGRSLSPPKGTTSMECCVNICKVTYFSILNQFMLSPIDLHHLCKSEADVSHSASILRGIF
jgi:hypothetical protein